MRLIVCVLALAGPVWGQKYQRIKIIDFDETLITGEIVRPGLKRVALREGDGFRIILMRAGRAVSVETLPPKPPQEPP